jgi:hypothetical protein
MSRAVTLALAIATAYLLVGAVLAFAIAITSAMGRRRPSINAFLALTGWGAAAIVLLAILEAPR